jgi:hypothetical protein
LSAGQDLDGDDRRMIEVVERAVEQMRAEQLTHPERRALRQRAGAVLQEGPRESGRRIKKRRDIV